MHVVAVIAGASLLLVVFWDAFETIVLPRGVTRRIGMTRLFYRTAWRGWNRFAALWRSPARRDGLLGLFGPLSLIVLLALWAALLVVGFGLLYWGGRVPLNPLHERHSLAAYLYMSGVTLFTLGFGDLTPREGWGRALAVLEAGAGMGFLAMVIGYLPVLYQSFSRREVGISLLDARGGSPPTAVELLRRHARAGRMADLAALLNEFERWAAELLESHLSYPVLTFYRSQHDRESWLAALAAILDVCALVRAGLHGHEDWQASLAWQADLTFAMARHTVVDLALILGSAPTAPEPDRLPPARFVALRAALTEVGLTMHDDDVEQRLSQMRELYEPFINGLAATLRLDLPPWMPEGYVVDNWETSAWGRGHLVS